MVSHVPVTRRFFTETRPQEHYEPSKSPLSSLILTLKIIIFATKVSLTKVLNINILVENQSFWKRVFPAIEKTQNNEVPREQNFPK